MLKLLSLLSFVMSFLGIEAQTTVTFDDETKLVLKGKLIGTFAKPDYPNTKEVEQYEKSFYRIDGDTIEITTYGEFPSKEMADLYIYRFHTNQLEIASLMVNEEQDDKGKFRHYSVSFNAVAGKELHHTSYNAMNSNGFPMSFSYFNVNSDQKEGLQELVKQVKLKAQTTVVFADKTTYALDGRVMGERKMYSYENPNEVEKTEKAFLKIDNDTIEIAVYTAFTNNKVDELWVYRFHSNQLNTQDLSISDETQDDGQFLFYTIDFAVTEGTFHSTKYTYENSKGEPLSFEFFNVNADQQEGLEALIHLISIN